MKKKLSKYLRFINKHKVIIIVLTIFLFEIFLRFYQLDSRNPFGYDQTDNAWAAKSIIIDHQFPLIGMPAKANSGISIPPVYYYMVATVYWLTNMDPIASGIVAGLSSIFTFWVLFYISKKLFSNKVAIIAVFIYTFIGHSITLDRVQVPINFIPAVSLLIFYVLYRITLGDIKKIIALAVLVGLSFNIHFTAIFYPLMIFLALPFFPRKKETLKYILISIPAFLIWVAPSIFAQFQNKTYMPGMASYLETNYHGFHLRRVIQLAGDGLIQFNQYLFFENLAPLKFIILPLFYFVYLFKSLSREKLIFCYLTLIWFVVPWFGFATYKGEISDYYFSISRFIALLIISYFFVRVWDIKNIIPKTLILIFLSYIAVTNIINFLPSHYDGLIKAEDNVSKIIKDGGQIKYQQGVPEAYIYYYLARKKGINVN